jgi:uncharacterized membrane protein YgcG
VRSKRLAVHFTLTFSLLSIFVSVTILLQLNCCNMPRCCIYHRSAVRNKRLAVQFSHAGVVMAAGSPGGGGGRDSGNSGGGGGGGGSRGGDALVSWSTKNTRVQLTAHRASS